MERASIHTAMAVIGMMRTQMAADTTTPIPFTQQLNAAPALEQLIIRMKLKKHLKKENMITVPMVMVSTHSAMAVIGITKIQMAADTTIPTSLLLMMNAALVVVPMGTVSTHSGMAVTGIMTMQMNAESMIQMTLRPNGNALHAELVCMIIVLMVMVLTHSVTAVTGIMENIKAVENMIPMTSTPMMSAVLVCDIIDTF